MATETSLEKEKLTLECIINDSSPINEVGDIHGDWLITTRHKWSNNVAKDNAKNNVLTNVTNKFEKLSPPSKAVAHVGNKGKGTTFIPLGESSKCVPTTKTKSAKQGLN